MSLFFGEVRQVAYLTRDLDAAMRFMVQSAGIGPWFVKDRHFPEVHFRGAPCELNLRIALANSGAVQFELIEPKPDERSLFNEWLQQHPRQLLVQHVASWPENYEAVHTAALGRGYVAVLEGDTETGPFAYFQHPERPELTFEVAKLTPERRAMFEQVALASQGWDGKDPVRSR
jgi:hypothetical protein